MATVTPLRRIEFASSDPLEIRDFLHRVRGSQMRLKSVRDRDWQVSLTQVNAGEFSSSQMRLPADLAFRMRGRDEIIIHTILGGAIAIEHGKASHRYRLGDVYVASCPRADFTCRSCRSLATAPGSGGTPPATLTACSPTPPPRTPRWFAAAPRGCSPPPP